jgi:hypothetical protein
LFSPLQFEALDLLSASQVAQLTLNSGALNNANLIALVFDRLDGDDAFQDVDEFLTALSQTPQVCCHRRDGKHAQVLFSAGPKNPKSAADVMELVLLLFNLTAMPLSACLSFPLEFVHQSCGEGHHDESGLRRHRPSF